MGGCCSKGFDLDGNGKVSLQEILKGLHDKIDVNGDGKINLADATAVMDSAKAAVNERLEDLMQLKADIALVLDRNKDGKVDAADFEHALAPVWEKLSEISLVMDFDGDGKITANDFALARKQIDGMAVILASTGVDISPLTKAAEGVDEVGKAVVEGIQKAEETKDTILNTAKSVADTEMGQAILNQLNAKREAERADTLAKMAAEKAAKHAADTPAVDPSEVTPLVPK